MPDWRGGTRLGGPCGVPGPLGAARHGARRGRRYVHDGWERGDAALLGEQMARLHRLAHRVVWVHPHLARRATAGDPGCAAALPHVDDLVAGHSLQAFPLLTEVVGPPCVT